MKKNIYLLFLGLVIVIFVAGCTGYSRRDLVNYYILDYIPHLDNENLICSTPFPYDIEISETQVPRTYQRNQIVEKNSINTITYLENHIWADKLYNSIPDILIQKTRKYNFFKSARSEFIGTIPDFYVDTFVFNIEKISDRINPSAHVKMDFYLRDKEQNIVVVHRTNVEQKVGDTSMISVVQTFSEIISHEYDKFLEETREYLVAGKSNNKNKSNYNIIKDGPYVDVMPDDKLEEYGELLVPDLAHSDKNPQVSINGIDNELITDCEMGEAIKLPVGKYRVIVGIGQDQVVSQAIDIKSKYRTIMKPNWGSLKINIINESKSNVRTQYDIYHADSGEAVGFDFSAADEAGEENRIWILPPGRYFITINGTSYSAYENFTTIDLDENEYYNLSIVVDEDSDTGSISLIGAGIHPQENDITDEQNWRAFNALHLNFNITSDNEAEEDNYDSQMNLIGQFDSKLFYEMNSFDYEGRMNWELNLEKNSDRSLEVTQDYFKFNNTALYYLWAKQFGLYSRVDFQTSFLNKYKYYDKKAGNVSVLNEDNVEVNVYRDVDKVRLNSSFFPLITKQDIGLNFKMNYGKYGNLSFRTGLGWKQTFNNDVFVVDETAGYTDVNNVKWDVLIPVDDAFTEGYSISLVGNISIPEIRFTWSSTADLLIPIDNNRERIFEFDNIFNIKLVKNVSWDVKFNMLYDPASKSKDYIIYSTSSYIRLSYFF